MWPVERTRNISPKSKETPYGLPFYLTLLYLLLEYGRPQETIPPLAVVHLPGTIIFLLSITLIHFGRVLSFEFQEKLFLALLIWMAVHVPFAVNNYWAYMTTRMMLVTFVAYLSIVHFVDSFSKFQTMMMAWLGIHIYLAVTGLMKGGRGLGGYFGDENDFALTLNMVIPYSFFLALEARTVPRRVLLLIVTGIFVVCNTVTGSRGGFIGLLAVGLYCWLRAPRKILSAVAVALLVLSVVQFAPKTYWSRIQTITEESADPDNSKDERIYSWKAAWYMFLDHPIVGVGSGNFPWNFELYEPPGGHAGKLHGGRAAHSLYFTLMPELGIPGIIIFVLILVQYVKARNHILRTAKAEKFLQVGKPGQIGIGKKTMPEALRKAYYVTLAIDGSLVGYLVSGTFISVLYYPHFWILLAFMAALKKVTPVEEEAEEGVTTLDYHSITWWPPPSRREATDDPTRRAWKA